MFCQPSKIGDSFAVCFIVLTWIVFFVPSFIRLFSIERLQQLAQGIRSGGKCIHEMQRTGVVDFQAHHLIFTRARKCVCVCSRVCVCVCFAVAKEARFVLFLSHWPAL